MAKDPRKAVLDELATIAARLAENDGLYARRLELFAEGRAMVPPILQRELAAAAGVTETAVTKELKRAAERSTA